MTSDDGILGKVTVWTSPQTITATGSNTTGGFVAVTLTPYGPPTWEGMAVFTNRGYGVTMHLTDDASHTSADLSFTGAISGMLNGNTFTLMNSPTSPTKQSVTLGGNRYTVSLNYNDPLQPRQPGGMDVTVVVSAPEPTSLVLAGIGLSALGLRCWRRGRQGV